MKKTNLMAGFSVLAALSLLGSGCGGSKKVVTTGGVVVTSGGSSGGIVTSSGGSSGGVVTSSGGSSGGVVTSSGGSSGGSAPVSSSGGSGGYSAPSSSGGYSAPSGSGGYSAPSSSGGSGGSSGGYSVDGNTKDVDLQRADAQSAETEDRAQALAASYSMDIGAARQLTQLADKMTQLQNQAGGMTPEDQAAITDAALGVAGITGDQVNTAYATAIQTKDLTPVNDLLTQGAANIGTSVTVLRDQILPSLGINVGTLGQ